MSRTSGLLQQSLVRNPTNREIADEIGVSEAAVQEVYQTQEMLRVASLDATPQGEDESGGELEKLDAASFCPEQLSVEDRVVLEHAMKQLRELERQVLLHFHFDAMNQTEIAAKLEAFPDIDYLVMTAGSFDLLAEVVVEDDAGLLELGNRIRGVPGVRSTETFIYLGVVKQTYAWGAH